MLRPRISFASVVFAAAVAVSAPACLLDSSPFADAGSTGLAGAGGRDAGGDGGATTSTTSTSTGGLGGGGGPGGAAPGGTGGIGAGGTGGTGAGGGGPIEGNTCPGIVTSIDLYQNLSFNGDTALATDDVGSGVCGGGDAPDIVYQVTAAGKGLLTLTLDSHPPFQGFLHVRKACGDPNQEVACSDAPITMSVEKGDVLYVFVDGHLPKPSGEYELQMYLDGCGNGVIDIAEECDDGNSTTGDACVDCKVNCTKVGSTTTNGAVFLHPQSKHCYLASFDPNRNWQDAQADCAGWGGHLAVLTDAAEITAVLPILSPAGELMWIGGHDMTTEGQFEWVNGEPFTYSGGQSPWANNEPNNYLGGEDCVEMDKYGVMNDEDCGDTQNYLCERPPPGAPSGR